MRNIYLRPNDRVHLVERRELRTLVHNALVLSISMNERLLGKKKEPAVNAIFVFSPDGQRSECRELEDVVHITHVDWLEGRSAMAYYEPAVMFGQCRYCGCTVDCACPDGCAWADSPVNTRCTTPSCQERYDEERRALAESMAEAVAA